MKFTTGDTVVDFAKLWFLQKRHAERYASSPPSSNPSHNFNNLALRPVLQLLDRSVTDHPERFAFYHTIPTAARENYVRDILWAEAKQYTDPKDFIDRNTYFWIAPTPETLIEKMPALRLHNVPIIASQPSSAALTPFFSNFSEIAEKDWKAAEIKSWIETITEQVTSRSYVELAKKQALLSPEETNSAKIQWSKVWNKLVYQYLRWALMGGVHGPTAAETMRILGRRETFRRLDVAKELLLARSEKERSSEEKDDSGADIAMMGAILATVTPSRTVSGAADIDGGAQIQEVENANTWGMEEEAVRTQVQEDHHEDKHPDNNDHGGGSDGGESGGGGGDGF